MSEKNHHINRREFIATGSLVVAGLAIPTGKAIAADGASPLALSVGFWGGAPRMVRRFISAPATFDAAQSVLTGDPSLFSLGVKLSFRGIYRTQTDQKRSVLVDALQKTADSTLPFFAFTHVEDGVGVRSSPPSAFSMDVDTQGTIDLSFRSRFGAQPEASTVVSFAINSADGALKLNRGVYIFAFADRAPEWRTVRFADGMTAAAFVTGGKPLLASAIDDRPVGFDYVVMTVGAASSPAKA
jgi:hypothetical protein